MLAHLQKQARDCIMKRARFLQRMSKIAVCLEKCPPPKDVPSAVSTGRVRGGGYLNLFLTVLQQQRERVPENNGT